MHPSDLPLPLTARIVVALHHVRCARQDGDPTSEWSWTLRLDRLLDTHIVLLKSNNRFRPLYLLDPDLDARLTVKLDYRLIGPAVDR